MNTHLRPFAAIIGGFHEIEENNRIEAKQTATELGCALAAAGFNLVVYSSDPESLEPHVVSGYVASPEATNGKIIIRYSSTQRRQIAFAEVDVRPMVVSSFPKVARKEG